MMNDTSGPTCGRQFAIYDPDSSSWRMWPGTGLWGSIEYSETWPRTGYMSDGQAFELPTWVPPTTGNGSSSSPHPPTPRTTDATNSMTAPSAMKHVADGFGTLPEVIGAKLLPNPGTPVMPTPMASDATGGGQHPSKRVGHTLQLIDTVLGLTSDPTPPRFEMEE